MRRPSPPGHLLTGGQLRDALVGGEIFRVDSWHEQGLRTTSYDVHLASDLCIVPDGVGNRVYDTGQHRTRPIVLKPGDSAVVSTMEKIALAWNITGLIGPKFSLSSQGMLILTGMCVDPGYGWELVDGAWVPKEDERLHFVICNVGPSQLVLVPGRDAIATVQFYGSEPPRERRFTPSRGFQALRDDYFASGDRQVGLAYFHTMREALALVKEQKTEAGLIEQRVHRIETGFNTVVIFGVYLIAVTIFGVVLATTVSVVSSLPDISDPATKWVIFGILGVLLLSTLICSWIAVRRVGRR